MNSNIRRAVILGFIWSLAGCAPTTPMANRTGNFIAPGGGGSAATATGTGAGGLGGLSNPAGVISTSDAGTVTAPPTPPVDPLAPTFKQDDSPQGGLDTGTLTQLANGTGTCTVPVSYPYDGTIFPGGLIPPTLMWNSTVDAAWVHFAYDGSDKVDYTFAGKLTAPAALPIPRAAWNELTRRTNRLSLIVTVKVLSGGMISSCQQRWKIAPGNMVGAIYYNTYEAPSPGVANEGAVMRQSLGASAEIYKQFTGTLNPGAGSGPCISCHSVSFDGSTIVASLHDYSVQTFKVEKYDITSATQPTATNTLVNANFGALTPDGKRILAMGNPQCTAGADTFPRKPNNFPLVEGMAVARMLDTATGMDLQAKGLNKDYYMWMPQFSPDGTKVVFNHAKPDGAGGSDRRELATMDYDVASNTFSNLKVIVSASKLAGVPAPTASYAPNPGGGGALKCGADMCGADGKPNSCTTMTAAAPALPVFGAGVPAGDVAALPMGSCTGPCYPAWPFFTPDNKAVVYSMTSEPDFTQAIPGRDKPSLSELWYVDLDTQQTVRLDNINTGLKPIDKQNNYYPTVMPVAVGGYFWVFWTAVRDYGNKLAGRDPTMAATTAVAEAIKKRIWAAAIKPKVQTMELQDNTLVDPSFPGFYLDGQSESGNVRAFAALNPCLKDGTSCMNGLDCCCGYCTIEPGATSGACTCTEPKCSKINEKCKTSADCCPPDSPDDPTPTCLGGFCGFVTLN